MVLAPLSVDADGVLLPEGVAPADALVLDVSGAGVAVAGAAAVVSVLGVAGAGAAVGAAGAAAVVEALEFELDALVSVSLWRPQAASSVATARAMASLCMATPFRIEAGLSCGQRAPRLVGQSRQLCPRATRLAIIRPMAYMLLIVEDPAQRATRTPDEGHAVYDRMLRYAGELKARGVLRAVESLTSLKDATRVQVQGGRAKVMDGPFAEAKEMVGGFFLLDCKTREEALQYARECPAAEWATVEVRETGPCYL